MLNARYWRVVATDTYGVGADLELTGLALYDLGVRVDGSATLSATIAPALGAVSYLADESPATLTRWAAKDVSEPGFAIVWDFGVPTTVDRADISASTLQDNFPRSYRLEASADAFTWSLADAPLGCTWPGAGGTTAVGNFRPIDPSMLMLFDGTAGSGSFPSTFGPQLAFTRTNGGNGFAALSIAEKVGGATSLYCPGLATTLGPLSSSYAVWKLGSAAFTFSAWVFPLDLQGGAPYIAGSSVTEASWFVRILSDGSLSCSLTSGGVSANVVGGVVPIGVWTHVAFEREGGTLRAYVGGALVAETAHTLGLPNPSVNRQLGLGSLSTNTNVTPFHGYIDEVTMYDGAAIYGGLGFRPAGYAARTGADPAALGAGAPTGFTPLVSIDLRSNGFGRVGGTVKVEAGAIDTPVAREVRLFRQADGAMLQSAWSDPESGAYEFQWVDEAERYFVAAFDHTGAFGGVIETDVVPVPMP